MKRYKPLDISKVKTYPLASRDNKVNIRDHFASPPKAGASFAEFFAGLPRLLGADSLRGVVEAVVRARAGKKPVILAIGGHVIKCGLQPVIRALLDAGAVTAVAMNGSAAIHDFEVSLIGATSEDVGAVLHSGDFGFAEETGGGGDTEPPAGGSPRPRRGARTRPHAGPPTPLPPGRAEAEGARRRAARAVRGPRGAAPAPPRPPRPPASA